MEKIIYSKCATERKKEYRIITSIVENNGDKLVYKKAMSAAAVSHVEHMYDVYTNNLFKNEFVKLTSCDKVSKGVIAFEYVNGESLASTLERMAEKRDWNGVLDWVAKHKKIIYSGIECTEFQSSEEFRAFFGDIKGLEHLPAAKNLNIDLIPENIILNNDEYYVIDYEWVMPFFVPVKYIMFRALFFTSVFGKVPEKIKEQALEIAEISRTDWAIFLEMEKNFQESVTDSALDVLYKEMKKDVFYTNNQTIGLKDINTIKAIDEKSRELFYMISRNLSQNITFKVIEDGRVKIQLAKEPSIIKIQNVEINGIEQKEYTTNCNLQIIDDYYFPQAAELEINARAEDEIFVSYKIFEESNDDILILSNALKENNLVKLENLELEKWNVAYKDRLEAVEQELNLIKNSKVWRLYSKLRGK